MTRALVVAQRHWKRSPEQLERGRGRRQASAAPLRFLDVSITRALRWCCCGSTSAAPRASLVAKLARVEACAAVPAVVPAVGAEKGISVATDLGAVRKPGPRSPEIDQGAPACRGGSGATVARQGLGRTAGKASRCVMQMRWQRMLATVGVQIVPAAAADRREGWRAGARQCERSANRFLAIAPARCGSAPAADRFAPRSTVRPWRWPPRVRTSS